jgi:UDP-GlcNAc:undecaprenyl-phosphate GlcNAc-1-phosphate transferase
MFFLFPPLLAAAISLALVPLVAAGAQRLGIIDQPGPRKIHQRPIPLSGGLAVYLAFAIVALVCWQLGLIDEQAISLRQIIAVVVAGGILMLGGILDDRYNLAPRRQIIFPIVATGLVLGSGITIQFVTHPFGGVLLIPAAVGVIVTGLWILGLTYTTKFLDGLDGLVSGITIIGALMIFIVSLRWDAPTTGAGFLPFNFHPAKIFLGEGGSLLCGFLLAVLAIISGSKIATVALVLAIPMIDMIAVLVRRWHAGASLVVGDSRHVHHQLLQLGLTQRQAVLVFYAIALGTGLAAIFLGTVGKILVVAIVGVSALAGILLVAKRTNSSL